MVRYNKDGQTIKTESFDENGDVSKTDLYRNGKIIQTEGVDEDGNRYFDRYDNDGKIIETCRLNDNADIYERDYYDKDGNYSHSTDGKGEPLPNKKEQEKSQENQEPHKQQDENGNTTVTVQNEDGSKTITEKTPDGYETKSVFDEKDRLKSETLSFDGKVQSETTFHKNGKMATDTQQYGSKQIKDSYDEEGKKTYRTEYDKDRLSKETFYHKNGKMSEEVLHLSSEREAHVFYDENATKTQAQLKNLTTGEQKNNYFDEQGNTLKTDHYDKDGNFLHSTDGKGEPLSNKGEQEKPQEHKPLNEKPQEKSQEPKPQTAPQETLSSNQMDRQTLEAHLRQNGPERPVPNLPKSTQGKKNLIDNARQGKPVNFNSPKPTTIDFGKKKGGER